MAASQEPPDAPMDSPQASQPLSPIMRASTGRLGMSFDMRLLLASASSFGCGFILGASHSGHMASLRFRAENAHRLPVSQPGWYLYHKSKNYYKMKEGISVGLRRGAHLASWTSVFFIIEESMDVFRGSLKAGRPLYESEGVGDLDIRIMDHTIRVHRDFLSSGMAGMVTGGIWSAWNRFPLVTAARTIRMGALVGLAYGLGQDGITYAQKRWGGPREESWIYKGARNRMKEEGEKVE